MIRKVISLSFFALALLIVSRGEASAQGIGAATLPTQCRLVGATTNVLFSARKQRKLLRPLSQAE